MKSASLFLLFFMTSSRPDVCLDDGFGSHVCDVINANTLDIAYPDYGDVIQIRFSLDVTIVDEMGWDCNRTSCTIDYPGPTITGTIPLPHMTCGDSPASCPPTDPVLDDPVITTCTHPWSGPDGEEIWPEGCSEDTIIL